MTYIKDAMDRVKAMCVQAFADNGKTDFDVVNYIPFAGETFPYATVRWAGTTKRQDYGQDFDNRVMTVEITLIVGNVDGGTRNLDAYERVNELYAWVVWIEDYFAQHPGLTSDSFPNKPQDFNPLEMELNSDNGIEILVNSGVGAQVFGTRITLTMSYIRINY